MERIFSKEQVMQCLSCRKCHDVIRDYNEVYQIEKQDCLQEGFEQYLLNYQHGDVIEELAQELGFFGRRIEKYNELKKLSLNTSVYEDECLNNISIILYAINGFYEENDRERIFEKYKNVIPVLNCMNEFNKEEIEDYPYEKYKQSISLFSKNQYENQKEEIRDALKNVFEMYCYTEIEEFVIDKGVNCGAYSFTKFVEGLDKKHIRRRKDFFDRVDRLDAKKKHVINNYLKLAPKSFSINLSKVMEEQNMSENDICKIIGTMSISSFQSLMECKEPKQKEDNIELVARALLVSKDVLYTGSGKRYGNWKRLLTDDSIDYIKLRFKEDGVNNTNVKDYLRTEIRKMIGQDESAYELMLKSVPELFSEEEYYIYENEIEEFDALLHPDEAGTLLKVLEMI